MSVSDKRRVEFLEDFDYRPKPGITVAYKAGEIKLVRLECAEQAVNRSKARYTEFKPPEAGIAAKISRKLNG